MKTGHRISLTTAKINYKTLRKINPEAPRLAVIEFLSTNKGNISDASRVFDHYGIPNYQWSAIEVISRFKLIAYSREKSWTNGLMFYLWVISWLRSHVVRAKIVFTVEHKEEWGGSRQSIL